jgi:hypothetical protein
MDHDTRAVRSRYSDSVEISLEKPKRSWFGKRRDANSALIHGSFDLETLITIQLEQLGSRQPSVLGFWSPQYSSAGP